MPDSPAAMAGLRQGDLILSINDQPAVSAAVVTRQIAHVEPGNELEIEVLRGNQQISLTARAGERPQR